MSDNLFEALNNNIHILAKQLGRNDISINYISSADLFYTDGSAVGAAFKLSPLGMYYTADGAEHFGSLADADRAIITAWINSVKMVLLKY